MSLFKEPKLAIINCLTGQREVASSWPGAVVIGWGGEPSFMPVAGPPLPSHCELAWHQNGCAYVAAGPRTYLAGMPVGSQILQKESDYSLQIGDNLFLLCLTKDPEKWLARLDADRWMLQDTVDQWELGPVPARKIAALFPSENPETSHIVFLKNARSAFYMENVRSVFESLSDASKASSKSAPPVHSRGGETDDDILVNREHGSLTCPTCWLRFDPGDVKHVAVHETMQGDPKLGEGAMRRFRATRFTDSGVALDPMGVATMDTACPHCHRKLPPDFLEIKHHIISIVGAQQSGKSYFLCVFTQRLQKVLYKNFGTAFVDADPSSNSRLTTMRDTLFGAFTATQAQVAKTELEGDMYESINLNGRAIKHPKPFIFNIQPPQKTGDPRAVIFYDNAGEHFQPGIDQTESPGTLHLARASGIIFLFDPAYNKEFRKRLATGSDPQLKVAGHPDIQDTILSEAKVRIKRVLGLDARDRLNTPLAFVVGKYDVWRDLVSPGTFADPLHADHFDISVVDRNSVATRDLMLDICPQVVAGAESVSGNVKYFPASAFGCSPEVIGADNKGNLKLSPDPNKIAPIFVEAPLLWLFSQIDPNLIPLGR